MVGVTGYTCELPPTQSRISRCQEHDHGRMMSARIPLIHQEIPPKLGSGCHPIPPLPQVPEDCIARAGFFMNSAGLDGGLHMCWPLRTQCN